MSKRVYLKEYDINLTANGIQVLLVEGEYFRIQSSSGAISINVDGLGELPGLLAGQGIGNTPFKRLVLRDVSGLANVGKLLVSNEEFIDNRTFGVSTLDAATLAALESVDLNAATIAKIKEPLVNTDFLNSNILLAAAGVQALVLPAANINGLIVLSAAFSVSDPAALSGALLAKNAAPANQADGQNLLNFSSAGNTFANVSMPGAVRLAAGLGLYFYSQTGMPASSFNVRSARWLLL